MDVYDGYIFECCFETEKYKKFQCLGVYKISGFQRKDAKTQKICLVYASGGYALHVVCACLGLIANHRGTECLWLRLLRPCNS